MPFTLREICRMAEAQRDVIKNYADIISAGFGISSDNGTSSDVMPYSPAVMEAMANSGKDIKHHGR